MRKNPPVYGVYQSYSMSELTANLKKIDERGLPLRSMIFFWLTFRDPNAPVRLQERGLCFCVPKSVPNVSR